MELKGLSWLLVGMVTCASADFFVSQPQLMLVDITELGTIKLQLEIAWKYGYTNPVSCFPEPLKEETVLFSWVVNLPSMFAYQCLCSKSF